MNDSIPELDAITAEFFTKLFQDTLNGLTAQVFEKIVKLEEQVEGIEKQIATLVLGYGEQAVFMEALVAQLAFATDEARKTFQEDVSRARKDMLEVMQSASKGFMAEQDPNLAAAIADMAESELSDTNK
jgi:hypothetical protein